MRHYEKKGHIQKHMSLAPFATGLSGKKSANQMRLKTDLILSRYIRRQVKQNTPVDTKEIMETAKEIYCGVTKKLNVETLFVFIASKGWVDNFLARHYVKIVTILGEAASGDR